MAIAFYRQLVQSLEQGAVVLATVIEVKGSVPREVGAKMLVCADGRTLGTIGGGAGEAKVIQQAMQVLETGAKQRVEVDLSGATHRPTQGICGGMMQVWVERWSADSIGLVQAIVDRLSAGKMLTLVTPFEQGQPYLLQPGAAPANAFVETLQPPPTLLIVGAGHVGIQLAQVAQLIGFQVVVQDDRAEWANQQRYPQAALILNEPIADAVAGLDTHSQLYVALVTRGYQLDLEALTAVLQRPVACRYIGMIGSVKRVQQVLQAIEMAGVAWQRAKIHAPIGLDIGALTPEEIAVSIAAELILVRRGGTGRPLAVTSG